MKEQRGKDQEGCNLLIIGNETVRCWIKGRENVEEFLIIIRELYAGGIDCSILGSFQISMQISNICRTLIITVLYILIGYPVKRFVNYHHYY